MTAPSTSVKYFHSAMPGAPVLNGTAGTLLAVLDACLVNGFGTKTADTLVVASGIATMTISSGVGALEADAVALIAGASPAGLNGEKRILTSTATAITFDATGIADQTATGTITAKLASAGWEKPFSGTNLAAYRSPDVTGTRFYLRVDDTAAQNGRVVGYESMSDINTGNYAFPTAAQMSGGLYWPKANSTASTARGWTLIADSKGLWLHLHTPATGTLGVNGWIGGFGDFTSLKSGDAYSCLITGTTTDVSASNVAQSTSISHVYASSLTVQGCYAARAYSGLGSAAGLVRRAESYSGSDGHSGTITSLASYPNGPDNSLILSRIAVLETTPHLRGTLRGVLYSPQPSASAFNWLDKVAGQGSYAGRKLLAIKGDGAPANTNVGSNAGTFFDIYGPWA